MNNLMKFENQDIEIILNENGQPLFELYSTGMALGQVKIAKGINYPRKERIEQNIKDAEITAVVRNGQQYLTEPMLYDLMLEMKTDKVKPFRKWVTSEVLPQIRKTGGYIPSNENDSDEDIMAKALLIAQNKIKLKNKAIEEKDNQLIEQQPKVIFADAVAASKSSILVGELAKLLRQNGVDIGEKRLFKWLRDNGYLIKRKGTDYNMPTQKSADLELFEVKETSIAHSDGHTSISKTPKVKGKGQIYFINKFKNLN